MKLELVYDFPMNLNEIEALADVSELSFHYYLTGTLLTWGISDLGHW